MHIHIRKAALKDCPRILELVKELAIYEKAPEEVTVTLDHFEKSGFGAQPVWWAYVAEVDNIIVGFALYYIRYSTWKGQMMYLEDILVTENFRGNGIGKLLFERLLEECKEKEFCGMAWQVLDWNAPAIHFYEKFSGVLHTNEWLNFRISL